MYFVFFAWSFTLVRNGVQYLLFGNKGVVLPGHQFGKSQKAMVLVIYRCEGSKRSCQENRGWSSLEQGDSTFTFDIAESADKIYIAGRRFSGGTTY